MAIQFKEMRPYLARNVRISLCLEETYEYFNYLLKSDIICLWRRNGRCRIFKRCFC